MTRLIDADALKFKNVAYVNGYLTHILTPEEIDNAPTVDKPYQEGHIDGMLQAEKLYARPHGKWVTFPTSRLIMQCPECTAFLSRTRSDIFKDSIGEMNFCPNCGAEMDMRGDSNDG